MNFLLLYRFMANLYITYTSCCHDTEGHYHSVLFVFWELAALGVEMKGLLATRAIRSTNRLVNTTRVVDRHAVCRQ